VALIYRDVLSEVARILEDGPSGGLFAGYRRKPALGWRLLPQAWCPTCANLADAEGRYLSTLIDHLPEPDFAEAYLAHGGLCLPHIERVLSYRPVPATSKVLLLAAIRSLRAALDSSAGVGVDGRPTLTQLMVGLPGGLTRREPLILPAGVEGGAIATAEEIIAALEGEVCPACVLARETDGRLLGQLPEDDAELHPWLCNLHAWQSLGLENGSAVDALLTLRARDVLGQLPERIPAIPGGEGRPDDGAGAPGDLVAELHSCLVESKRTDVEIRWATSLAEVIQVPAVQAAFRRSPGLCLPHLIQALRCTDPTGSKILARLEAERIAALVGELDEYIRKHDYRFREEPWGQEVTSPRRAVELMVGVEGLRGVGGLWWPDLRR
jgi:hypothetical protein